MRERRGRAPKTGHEPSPASKPPARSPALHLRRAAAKRGRSSVARPTTDALCAAPVAKRGRSRPPPPPRPPHSPSPPRASSPLLPPPPRSVLVHQPFPELEEGAPKQRGRRLGKYKTAERRQRAMIAALRVLESSRRWLNIQAGLIDADDPIEPTLSGAVKAHGRPLGSFKNEQTRERAVDGALRKLRAAEISETVIRDAWNGVTAQIIPSEKVETANSESADDERHIASSDASEQELDHAGDDDDSADEPKVGDEEEEDGDGDDDLEEDQNGEEEEEGEEEGELDAKRDRGRLQQQDDEGAEESSEASESQNTADDDVGREEIADFDEVLEMEEVLDGASDPDSYTSSTSHDAAITHDRDPGYDLSPPVKLPLPITDPSANLKSNTSDGTPVGIAYAFASAKNHLFTPANPLRNMMDPLFYQPFAERIPTLELDSHTDGAAGPRYATNVKRELAVSVDPKATMVPDHGGVSHHPHHDSTAQGHSLSPIERLLSGPVPHRTGSGLMGGPFAGPGPVVNAVQSGTNYYKTAAGRNANVRPFATCEALDGMYELGAAGKRGASGDKEKQRCPTSGKDGIGVRALCSDPAMPRHAGDDNRMSGKDTAVGAVASYDATMGNALRVDDNNKASANGLLHSSASSLSVCNASTVHARVHTRDRSGGGSGAMRRDAARCGRYRRVLARAEDAVGPRPAADAGLLYVAVLENVVTSYKSGARRKCKLQGAFNVVCARAHHEALRRLGALRHAYDLVRIVAHVLKMVGMVLEGGRMLWVCRAMWVPRADGLDYVRGVWPRTLDDIAKGCCRSDMAWNVAFPDEPMRDSLPSCQVIRRLLGVIGIVVIVDVECRDGRCTKLKCRVRLDMGSVAGAMRSAADASPDAEIQALFAL